MSEFEALLPSVECARRGASVYVLAAPSGDQQSVASGVQSSPFDSPSVRQLEARRQGGGGSNEGVCAEAAQPIDVSGFLPDAEADDHQSEASLSLDGLPLSDDASLFQFAESRIITAVKEPSHENTGATPDGVPRVVPSVTGECDADHNAAPQSNETPAPAAILVVSQPLHQQRETDEGREEEERLHTEQEKTPSEYLLWKRKNQRAEAVPPSVGDMGRRGDEPPDWEWSQHNQIPIRGQWTEEDAQTMDGGLTDRLISFSHDAAAGRTSEGGVASLGVWLRNGATERERTCFRRMAGVGCAFFDSPWIERALKDDGIPLGQFKGGVELLLHLHPAQLLQLYLCFLAATCTPLSSFDRRSDLPTGF
uniref:Uncharacterized protein n=1 Tax=Chromera velia CCMP2878 TaxID=1169474 RepID=A0A0G4HV41_9ALVE|eukprot:Cvel_8731.t1-p1 / transcript=Cvel_8731.t1 / gene=Cvel_8731 / organism=Chromera_velia_CCMP2878 / gene_product=hypothetical protein / transcript_product=hypothetical protein / location=Cvel_scaffold488:40931-42438(+) / protein_length=365 / sequence_SO=supercontig / SO=protein_coding / is_pseudo=false